MIPPRTSFIASLLALGAFCLALTLDPWSAAFRTERSGGFFEMLLGDGRRLFANHFFAKADAYFHRGVYPSIFDAPRQEEMHMVSESASAEGEAEENDHDHAHGASAEPGPSAQPPSSPPDWIARINQHFSPADHAHLEGDETREMLPWLKLSAELDPNNVQNFTVTAYWLRKRLHRVDEAEQFLREGLRLNPGSPEILLELGLIDLEERKNTTQAANLLELALSQWTRREQGKAKPDVLVGAAILIRLAQLEEAAGRYGRALEHLQALRSLSPEPEAIDRLIDQVRAKMAAEPTAPAPK